ncbi:hypothetical protein MVEG_04777 [Podila verticillata NRRL 6337]|nr:hypothetical protein MVEG_04777 [Podila verticillata NRRL 6337]
MVVKDEFTTKKKSLSIHIDTTAQGPHGMPLVYGSSSGSIKGSVHFACNYDCKGRDIMIIYEAWTETRWTTLENKKTVNHLSKNMFGNQTWSFPLIHTKANGSTVVGGNYVQEFDIPLVPQDSTSLDSSRRSIEHGSRFSRKSRSSSSASRSSTSSISSTCPYLSSSPSSASSSSSSLHETLRPQSTPLPPSSNLCPESRVKYTIRAVLQRPFPSLSNFEASQEVWVINTPTSTAPVSQTLTESVSNASLSTSPVPSEPTVPFRSLSTPLPPKPEPEATPQSKEETTSTSKTTTATTTAKTVTTTSTSTSSSPTFYLTILALLLVAFALNSFLSSTLAPSSAKITI